MHTKSDLSLKIFTCGTYLDDDLVSWWNNGYILSIFLHHALKGKYHYSSHDLLIPYKNLFLKCSSLSALAIVVIWDRFSTALFCC